MISPSPQVFCVRSFFEGDKDMNNVIKKIEELATHDYFENSSVEIVHHPVTSKILRVNMVLVAEPEILDPVLEKFFEEAIGKDFGECTLCEILNAMPIKPKPEMEWETLKPDNESSKPWPW